MRMPTCRACLPACQCLLDALLHSNTLPCQHPHPSAPRPLPPFRWELCALSHAGPAGQPLHEAYLPGRRAQPATLLRPDGGVEVRHMAQPVRPRCLRALRRCGWHQEDGVGCKRTLGCKRRRGGDAAPVFCMQARGVLLRRLPACRLAWPQGCVQGGGAGARTAWLTAPAGEAAGHPCTHCIQSHLLELLMCFPVALAVVALL